MISNHTKGGKLPEGGATTRGGSSPKSLASFSNKAGGNSNKEEKEEKVQRKISKTFQNNSEEIGSDAKTERGLPLATTNQDLDTPGSPAKPERIVSISQTN